ncbi:MAG TPA: 4-(cytidine 5'-diphospho)-2-C-methyl-D-erythritol kinase [Syntrophales bacterium]|nr:4-(cytidine 5'-diphospho)-2-C-methyl-D-erythritol kinase [Syntrophales bacterium]HPI58103.1 4-(cytidine 5'-diphospho)-2-C-methyl-D-erythritol kinase [Syntrophales bacterium]HPN24638.1 4-(cytidine 5'-diphospho)-2-C-methyl-D-erythritol kinase [Syntrophales bacterium]HQM28943.1 4-(cytidine 5'-diphospho)-2-C-methyl-D-erythritol kinase [Syntrophales bacterium]
MIRKDSPAKVNLILKVLGKRPDGYHDIESLLQKVSLYDELSFSPGDKGIRIRCPGTSLPEDEDNIVHRAASALMSRLPPDAGVEITIRKKIPVAAGLGGGSSNAAATLCALNELFGLKLRKEDLMDIGRTLGADIPFFIYADAAWAFGIGERLYPAEHLPKMWFVLANPGFEVSTRTVYEALNLALTKKRRKDSIRRFKTVSELAAALWNDLEGVTFHLHPKLREVKDLFVKLGAVGSLMSGSGPTLFGLFESEGKAARAEEALKRSTNYSIFRAHSI